MNSFTRKAEANWKGNLSQGHGLISTESRVLTEEKISFEHRTGDNKEQTNPEELIGAAAAGCFAMALSKTLEDDGKTPEKLRVHSEVTLTLKDDGPAITDLLLKVDGAVAGYSAEQFHDAVRKTEAMCPVAQLLKPGLEKVSVEVETELAST